MPLDLAEFARLEAERTPGPWEANGTGAYVAMMSIFDDKIRKYVSAPQAGMCASDVDIAFITFCGNHASSILAELTAARKVVEAAEAFMPFTRECIDSVDAYYTWHGTLADRLYAYRALEKKP